MPAGMREIFSPFFSYILFSVETSVERPFDVVRAEIKRLLSQQRDRVRVQGIPEPEYELALFAAVAWADDIVLRFSYASNRALWETWKKSPLQVELFHSSNAGEEFFEKLAALRPQDREICEIYHLCLSVGFRGRYYMDTQEHRLVELRREHAQHLPDGFMEVHEIERDRVRVTPQPYDASVPTPRDREVPRWLAWAFRGLPFVVAAALLWGMGVYRKPVLPTTKRTREEVVADIEDQLRSFSCSSLAVADFSNGQVSLEGRVESEDQRAEVHSAVKTVPEVGAINDAATVLPRPFCDVVELLTPFRQHGDELGAGLLMKPGKPCDATYHQDELLTIEVAAGRPLQFLYVDYFTADRATVAHVLPSANQPDNAVGAGSSVVIGAPDGGNRWRISPPWGVELVTVITSPKPLFERARTLPEPATTYIEELRRALPNEIDASEVIAQYCFITTAEH
jgi:type IV/VI secretion system ImpK/VasF family protein